MEKNNKIEAFYSPNLTKIVLVKQLNDDKFIFMWMDSGNSKWYESARQDDKYRSYSNLITEYKKANFTKLFEYE